MIRGKLYHYLESKKETPQQDTMKEDEKAVYEDEHKHSRQKKEPRYDLHSAGTHLGFHHPRVKDTLNPIGHKQRRDAHLEAHKKENRLSINARAEGKHDLGLHHSAKSEWHKAQADAHHAMTNKDYHSGNKFSPEDDHKIQHAENDYLTHKDVLRDTRAIITHKDQTKVGKIQQMMANEKKKQRKKTKVGGGHRGFHHPDMKKLKTAGDHLDRHRYHDSLASMYGAEAKRHEKHAEMAQDSIGKDWVKRLREKERWHGAQSARHKDRHSELKENKKQSNKSLMDGYPELQKAVVRKQGLEKSLKFKKTGKEIKEGIEKRILELEKKIAIREVKLSKTPPQDKVDNLLGENETQPAVATETDPLKDWQIKSWKRKIKEFELLCENLKEKQTYELQEFDLTRYFAEAS